VVVQSIFVTFAERHAHFVLSVFVTFTVHHLPLPFSSPDTTHMGCQSRVELDSEWIGLDGDGWDWTRTGLKVDRIGSRYR
jgi:hypothetical protein